MTPPHRLAVFLSHLVGDAVLAALFRMKEVEVVLVSTDDPSNNICKPNVRDIWRYSSSKELALLVPRRAASMGLSAFTGDVRSEDFVTRFRRAAPQAILSAVFGQLIPKERLLDVERRAWNLHPTLPGQTLAATRGGRPISIAQERKAEGLETCLHVMTPRFDDGPEVERSPLYSFPLVDELTAEMFVAIQGGMATHHAALVETLLPGLLAGPPPMWSRSEP